MITITGNVPSLKNSKRFVRLRNGMTKLIPSKTVLTYIDTHNVEYELAAKNFASALLAAGPPPWKIGFYFIRDSKRRFDYINAAQIVQDLMVKNGWIEDDNCDFLLPVFNGYEYDKLNPGVIITIEK